MSNCKHLWIARKQQHRQTAGKDHRLGKRDGVPQKERERQMDIKREEEGGRMQCFMKKEPDRCRKIMLKLLAKGVAI